VGIDGNGSFWRSLGSEATSCHETSERIKPSCSSQGGQNVNRKRKGKVESVQVETGTDLLERQAAGHGR
jgi:hypothetical protein